MKAQQRILIAVVAIITCYAARTTYLAAQMGAELNRLQDAHLKLQERHQQMKDGYLRLAMNPGGADAAFRNVLRVLEAEDGVELITSSDAGNTRINKWQQPQNY